MAAPDLTRVLHAPARLIVGPTALTGSYPYGGTGLGLCQGLALRPGRAHEKITQEALGTEVVDVLDLGYAVVLAAVLRDWDDDALNRLFPGGAAGSSSGHRVLNFPGTDRAGTLRAGAGVVLLVVADAPEEHPSAILYRAVPLLDETAELQMRLDAPLQAAAIFVAVRDGSGRCASMGLLEDLAL